MYVTTFTILTLSEVILPKVTPTKGPIKSFPLVCYMFKRSSIVTAFHITLALVTVTFIQTSYP